LFLHIHLVEECSTLVHLHIGASESNEPLVGSPTGDVLCNIQLLNLCYHCYHGCLRLVLLLQVSELKAQLAQAKSQQDKLRGEAAAAAAARDSAQERASALRSEVEQLQFMLDEVHAARTDSPPSKVRGGTLFRQQRWCWGHQLALDDLNL
jgi:hypothetical protein